MLLQPRITDAGAVVQRMEDTSWPDHLDAFSHSRRVIQLRFVTVYFGDAVVACIADAGVIKQYSQAARLPGIRLAFRDGFVCWTL